MTLFFISSPYLLLMLLSHLHPHNLNRRVSPLPARTSLYYRCDDLDKKCWGTLGDGHTSQTGCIFCFDMSKSKQRDRKRKKKCCIETFRSIFALLDICYLSLWALIWEKIAYQAAVFLYAAVRTLFSLGSTRDFPG